MKRDKAGREIKKEDVISEIERELLYYLPALVTLSLVENKIILSLRC